MYSFGAAARFAFVSSAITLRLTLRRGLDLRHLVRGVSGDTGVRRVLEVLRCRLERGRGLLDAVPAARVLRGELDLPLAPAPLGGLLGVRPADVPGQNLRAPLMDVMRLRRRLMLTVCGGFGASRGVAEPALAVVSAVTSGTLTWAAVLDLAAADTRLLALTVRVPELRPDTDSRVPQLIGSCRSCRSRSRR
jgi:hypothetical protein